MTISFSATNPCHLYDLARAVSALDIKVNYYSGYPKWRLNKPHLPESSLSTHSFHTLITYGLLRLPNSLRPSDDTLFTWQDRNFDKAVSNALSPSDIVHGLPGQCLQTFRTAKKQGSLCILNHASGPVGLQIEKLSEESQKLGIPYFPPPRFNTEYFERENEEYELADFHCAASSIVAKQLEKKGILPEKIIQIPYGADSLIFKKRNDTPDSGFHVIFAGVKNIRKGIPHLLDAFEKLDRPDFICHFYGANSDDTSEHFQNYSGNVKLIHHQPVSQSALGQAMRKASVLVLPSIEEAFGLVVAQALQSGIPCIVTQSTGAKDLIEHRKNGSIVKTGNAEELANELIWWSENPTTIKDPYTWQKPAEAFIEAHRSIFQNK